ncbi:MAG: hypothetical protein ACRCWG_11275 [Sarcina sp.]
MKKLLVLALCTVLTGSFLVGCGSSNEKVNDKGEEKIEKTEQAVEEEEEKNKVAGPVKVAEIDIKGLTEDEFKASAKVEEITKDAKAHYDRVVAGEKAMGETFENSSTGSYNNGALSGEKIFAVNFSNKNEESSLDTIATEFGVDTKSEIFGNKVIMKFTISKDEELIISDEEIKIIKAMIPELEKEDLKKQLEDLIVDSKKGPGGYSYDYKVDEPSALYMDTVVPEGEVGDIVINLVFWGNYNYA